jgi:hypothetical protein
MKLFRHVLLTVLLLLAQTGALTHGVEHLRFDADTPASHSCSLCIATQGLDAAPVSTPPAIALPVTDFAPPASVVAAAFDTPAVTPRARAPPAA